MKKNFLVFTTLFILSFCTYSNSLHNEFLLDDHGLILQDPLIHDPKFTLLQFIPNINKTMNLEEGHISSYYRPFAHIVLVITYFLFRDNTFAYHLSNLCLFLLTAITIYFLTLSIFENFQVALLVSSLFCVHPINGLLVNYITASVFELQIIFMSLCFINFIRSKKINILLSVFFYVLAIFCHETAIMMPGYLAAYMIYKNKIITKNSFIQLIPFFLVLLGYLIFRFLFASIKSNLIDKFYGLNITLFEFTATYTKLIIQYFKNFFTMSDIVMIWLTDAVTKYLLLWNLLFLGILGLAAFTIVGIFRQKQWSLALTIFLIGLLPISLGCVFRSSSGFMIEPHWLFFPSIGLFAFIALIILKITKNLHRLSLLFLLIGILSINIISSRLYNYLWANEIRYCLYWHNVVPQYGSLYFHIANGYQYQNNYDLAEEYYKRAILNKFEDWQVYTNLGLIKYSQGNTEEAIKYYDKARMINPKSSVILNDLAVVLLQIKDFKRAKEILLNGIHINPYVSELRLNLAEIYKHEGDWINAKKMYTTNLSLLPQDFESNFKLIELLLQTHNIPEMLKSINETLKNDLSIEQLNQVGTLLAFYKFPDIARIFYTRALELNINSKETYLEFGKLEGNLNNFSQAIKLWERGKMIDPTDSRFTRLINEAQQLQNQLKE